MEKQQGELRSLIERAMRRTSAVAYEGFIRDDVNLPGNILVVETPENIYSFPETEVVEEEPLPAGRTRIWVRIGAQGYHMSSFAVGSLHVTVREDMENIPPPPPKDIPGAPRPASARRRDVKNVVQGTLPAVGAAWTKSCAGKDSYKNNCAHFLSDAFILAGFSELKPPNSHINARCDTTAKRPVRARDMWSWFQAKAVKTKTKVEPKTGWWAVFQLKESVYWGGHVLLLDSDKDEYYGTEAYWDWEQYLYQW